MTYTVIETYFNAFPQLRAFVSKRTENKKKFKPYPSSKLCDPMKHYEYGEVWGTLDGQLIPIVNLRDSHLENTIHHVKKRKLQGILPYLEAEVDRRKKLKLIKKTKAGKLLYGKK